MLSVLSGRIRSRSPRPPLPSSRHRNTEMITRPQRHLVARSHSVNSLSRRMNECWRHGGRGLVWGRVLRWFYHFSALVLVKRSVCEQLTILAIERCVLFAFLPRIYLDLASFPPECWDRNRVFCWPISVVGSCIKLSAHEVHNTGREGTPNRDTQQTKAETQIFREIAIMDESRWHDDVSIDDERGTKLTVWIHVIVIIHIYPNKMTGRLLRFRVSSPKSDKKEPTFHQVSIHICIIEHGINVAVSLKFLTFL